MNHSDLLKMSLKDYCELYRSGNLPDQFKNLTLNEIAIKAGEESASVDEEQYDIVLDHEQQEKSFQWREKFPNSNNTNVPLVLWRGDENNGATLALAFGLYDDEFSELKTHHSLEVEVKASDGEATTVKFDVDLDFPKDEKLARKHAGLAGSGSDNLCTYCSCSRNTIKNPPHSGDACVTLTNTLLKEASHYCRLNPARKSQAAISKIALGIKETPLSSTEPGDERPDALHLDINVTKHLITIAARLFHHKESGQPLRYEKTEVDKKEMENSEAKYYKILREKIATLPELTQCPGNFAREFLDECNADFVRKPLPDIPEADTWNELMELWRKMRSIHKSSRDPTDEEIGQFKSWVISFQEKIFSFQWVPVANQIHRLSHIAFFMQTKPIRSLGAYSLEGLEHGNFSTKDGEARRIWRGNSKESNKQLFRLLRMHASPSLRRVSKLLEGKKRKQMKCSKCGLPGHKRTNRKCRLFLETEASQDEETIDTEDDINLSNDAEDETVTELELSFDEDSAIETTVIVDQDGSILSEERLDGTDLDKDQTEVLDDSFEQCTTS